MNGKRYRPEQIIHKLREAEVEFGKGATVPVVCKKLGVTEQTYYRWRTEYGACGWTMATRQNAWTEFLERTAVDKGKRSQIQPIPGFLAVTD